MGKKIEGKTYVTHNIPVPAYVYAFSDYGNDGSFGSTLKSSDGWQRLSSSGALAWGHANGVHAAYFGVWRKYVSAFGQATIKVGSNKWTGGVILKMDCGE